jgi:hypothetical protein
MSRYKKGPALVAENSLVSYCCYYYYYYYYYYTTTTTTTTTVAVITAAAIVRNTKWVRFLLEMW